MDSRISLIAAPRFAKLMGQHISYGWRAEGPVLDGSETLIGSTAIN